MREDLVAYISNEIIPLYERFDAAHRREHVDMVIAQSLQLAEQKGADPEMAYVIAAYHDTGLSHGRETHHLVSGEIIRKDACLRRWFTTSQIEIMAEAAEDHRASAEHVPRSLYGKIVAEADRYIEPEVIIRRTIQYGLDHYPELDKEQHYQRMLAHLHEKYYYGGYLKLWFEDSPNAIRLERLRKMIDDESCLRGIFDEIFRCVQ